jgi:hypothetical protein
MKEQLMDYDIYMYLEDDILIPKSTIDYWLKYNVACQKDNKSLGFVRLEYSGSLKGYVKNSYYMTDILYPLKNKTLIEGESFIINDVNPYCGFWIYDKKTFFNFQKSKYYDASYVMKLLNCGVREAAAFGLNFDLSSKDVSLANKNGRSISSDIGYFDNIVIPCIDDKLHLDCKVYHLPNNYMALNRKIRFPYFS